MAKKRKESSQSSTLLDYFGKPGSAKKKAKVSERGHKVSLKHKASSIDPVDIIVIDSDDEEPGSCRAPTIDIGSSSDIEFVEGPSIPRQRKGFASETHDAVLPVAQRTARSPRSAITDHLAFGEPSLLLSDDCAASDTVLPSAGNDFGLPSLLVSSVTVPPEGLPKAPSESVLSHPQDACDVLVPPEFAPTTEDEEWGTGDDEIDVAEDNVAEDDYALAREEDVHAEEAEVDIDLTLADEDDPPSTHSSEELCPICGTLLRALGDMDIQNHVSRCLEKSDEDSPSKPLRPLSSLRAPPYSSVQGGPAVAKGKGKTKDSNAFAVMMTSYRENEAWKEATVAEDRNFRPSKGNGGRRKAPFYKVMTGMPIAVDAFRYGTIPDVTAYFLTHAHSDHYTNLSSNWRSGPIYCSEGTANLIIHMLAVDPKWVHPLPMDTPTLIPDTGGVHVTLIEANHCPGSSLFLFEGRQTVNAGDSTYKSAFVGSNRSFRYLHCGDFRASPQHVHHPAIKGKRIDTVYLDTTYLDPRYCFPSQPEVIAACADLSRKLVNRESVSGSSREGKTKTVDNWFVVKEKPKDEQDLPKGGGKTLFVVGTYSIGKERVVKAVAHALQTKVYCDARKAAILRCQSDPELHALLTNDPYNAGVHLVPLGTVASDRLKVYIERWKGHFDRVVGFRPTGWTFSPANGTDLLPSIPTVISRSQSRTFSCANLMPMKNSTPALTVYGVPYSEHSSFFELTCFALSFDWGRMIATVNVGSEGSRGKMAKWVERWEAERKKRGKVEVVPHRAADYW